MKELRDYPRKCVAVSISMPTEILDWLRHEAEKNGMSLSARLTGIVIAYKDEVIKRIA